MNEYAKIILPVVLTGIGAVLWTLIGSVADIKKTQVASQEYIYRIEQLEIKVKSIENRYYKKD